MTLFERIFRRRHHKTDSTIGQGCHFEGILRTEGSLRIEGTVCGPVSVNGDVMVSETGLIEGPEIRGHDITVLGVVKAHVYAEGKLTLGATARIDGNVIAGIIEVDPGAYYTGHLATHDSRTPFYGEINELAGLAKPPDSHSYNTHSVDSVASMRAS